MKSLPAKYVYLNVGDKNLNEFFFQAFYYTVNRSNFLKMIVLFRQAVIGLKAAIRKDYLQTRQCKLTIAGEASFMKQTTGWGLAKKSPYLEEFNRG